jgi:hypothetical protein
VQEPEPEVALLPGQQSKLARDAKDNEHVIPEKLNAVTAVIDID